MISSGKILKEITYQMSVHLFLARLILRQKNDFQRGDRNAQHEHEHQQPFYTL